MTYTVVIRDGRVQLLSEVKDSDEILQSIEADCWINARAKVKEGNLWQHEGHGWFKQ